MEEIKDIVPKEPDQDFILNSESDNFDEMVEKKVVGSVLEGINDELESTKRYLSIVLKELEEAQQEVEKRNERENQGKKVKRVTKVWKRIAVFEFILLTLFLVFLGINYFKDELKTIGTFGNQKNENPSDIPNNSDNNGSEESIEVSKKTRKLVENLKEEALLINISRIEPFTASVETWYGYEYLCFSYLNMKVYYRNEFDLEDEEERDRIVIDNGSKRVEYNWDYNLSGNLEELCPVFGSYSGDNNSQFVFILYEDTEFHETQFSTLNRIPKEIKMIEAKNLWEYNSIDLEEEFINLFQAEYQEVQTTASETSDKLGTQMVLTIGDVEYVYQIQIETYINAVYYEENPLKVSDYITLTINPLEISILAVVYLSENEYLGQISGVLVIEDRECLLKNVRYGAYVEANQEDIDSDNVIIPRTTKIGDYVTIAGKNKERFIIELSDKVERNPYDYSKITRDSNGYKAYYEDGEEVSIMGIDVSKFQGDINWTKVKDAGVQFAIIRLGYRGFNIGEGNLYFDPYYEKNIEGALSSGIAVGVYFFSQAINEAEALEEAEMVISSIKNYNITYPVIFDTEVVTNADARANDLTRQARTDIAKTFCEAVKKAGYRPMIYANTKWMVMGLDLEQLTEYDKWFAYYGDNLTFPYRFDILQYSDTGKIPGISSNVDLNISFIDYANPN